MLVWFRLHELAWEGQIMLDGRALPRVLTALAICKPYSNEKKSSKWRERTTYVYVPADSTHARLQHLVIVFSTYAAARR
jgi:hypothetical protein